MTTADPKTADVPWAAIADRLTPYVRRHVASAPDADDVVQEVLLKMHGGLGTLRDEDRFIPWAFGIARRAIVDHQRARGRLPTPTAELPEPAEPGPQNEDAAANEALTSVIATFVAALPTPYRQAVVLTELEGRSHQQAADMEGVSLTAMKSRVRRGRAKLRHMLERCCAIELDARNRVVAVEPRPDGELPAACCETGCEPSTAI